MAFITSDRYKEVIYSGDAKHQLRLTFGGVELEDADYYCEKLTVTSRVLPTGGKIFTLDNFIAKEATLILHDIMGNENVPELKNPVVISIGTLVDNEYEEVPIGVFNIQDTPTTDNGKTTIKLRDNAVLFDFPYNPYPLMEEASKDGGEESTPEEPTVIDEEPTKEDEETVVEVKAITASKAQILQDICDKAGVHNGVTDLLFGDEQTGFVDSSMNARTYISYLAEQSGAIATIDRYGNLIFVNVNNLSVQHIPFNLVEKYTVGKEYLISQTIYEDAIRRFVSGELTDDIIYLNTANPYIISQEQVDAIHQLLEGVVFDSLNTGKIIGNPAIDAYDLIVIETDEGDIYTTLGNNTLTYNGVMINTFDTEIGIEERKQNVFINDDTSFQRWAKTEIDNANARITFQTAESQKISQDLGEMKDDLANNYYQKDYVNNLVIEASSGVTNTFSEAGGNNILRNTNFSATEVLEEGQDYEYWFGKLTRQSDSNAVNGFSAMLKNGNLYQEQQVANGQYTLSFYYKKTNPFANVLVRVNGKEYELTETETFTLFQTGIKDSETGEYITDPIIVGTNFLKVEFITDIDDSCVIYDIMCNVGTVRLAYSQNANESTTDTVNISKGITITSSVSNIKFVANYNGIYTLPKNSSVGKADSITEFTDKGMKTKTAVVENEAQIVGILRQRVGDQIWDSMIV